PQPHQEHACQREAADEGIALLVDRRDLPLDRIENGHRYLPPKVEGADIPARRNALGQTGGRRQGHSAAAGVVRTSSTGGGSRFGASLASSIRASFSR